MDQDPITLPPKIDNSRYLPKHMRCESCQLFAAWQQVGCEAAGLDDDCGMLDESVL